MAQFKSVNPTCGSAESSLKKPYNELLLNLNLKKYNKNKVVNSNLNKSVVSVAMQTPLGGARGRFFPQFFTLTPLLVLFYNFKFGTFT